MMVFQLAAKIDVFSNFCQKDDFSKFYKIDDFSNFWPKFEKLSILSKLKKIYTMEVGVILVSCQCHQFSVANTVATLDPLQGVIQIFKRTVY